MPIRQSDVDPETWLRLMAAAGPPKAAAKSKFGNRKTVVDGITFDSKKEASRYLDLKAMLASGTISDLRIQVAFPLVVNGVTICKYVSDFVYVENGEQVVEDVKSAHTRKLPVYRLKLKMMKACLGLSIREV